MTLREHGTAGPRVIVLHGGPGAPGYMAPVARRLAGAFRVLEPFQRGSGGTPLTVARHVADLHALVEERCAGERPALVGHSWGAMLALAYAAAHPDGAASLALVGCGTFDPVSRARLESTREARTDVLLRRRIASLDGEIFDPDARLRAMGDLLLPVYSYDPTATMLGTEACDARAYRESWADMIRLQDAGIYPAAFAAIGSPVLMLHGTTDPHPGRMIRDRLAAYLPHLEYRELDRCGHYPWLERLAQDEFFDLLDAWLA